ncbi:MAG: HepT-like ribonuclease domain-containing protein [Kiritimatiellales bacterium]
MSETPVEILSQILAAAERILLRFEPVESSDDFLESEAGLEKLDGICMQLIAIGESLKNLDKIAGPELLKCYPQVHWKEAKAMRDVISHHYFDLNGEAVFDVCRADLPAMIPVLKQMIEDLKANN